MHPILNATAVAATLLGSGMALPQARRLFTTRRVEGVSAAWVGVSVALNAWWLVYGVTQQVWALVPVSGLSLLLYASIGVLFVHTSGTSCLRSMVGAGVALAVVPLGFLLAGGWSLAGLVVGLCYGLQLLPAVVTAHRSADLTGVSPGTWAIAWAEALLWLVYGLAVGDVALVAGGSTGVVMASAILVRLRVVRSRTAAPAVETAGTVIRVAPAR